MNILTRNGSCKHVLTQGLRLRHSRELLIIYKSKNENLVFRIKRILLLPPHHLLNPLRGNPNWPIQWNACASQNGGQQVTLIALGVG
jgi:hypothetical protein